MSPPLGPGVLGYMLGGDAEFPMPAVVGTLAAGLEGALEEEGEEVEAEEEWVDTLIGVVDT